MNTRFNNVSAVRGTTISYLLAPNASAEDIAAIQEMETRLVIQEHAASAEDIAAIQEMETRLAIQEQTASAEDIAAIQEMETRLAIQEHTAVRQEAAERPIHIWVVTMAAHPIESRVTVPDVSEERIRELRSIHFAQQQVQPARVRHLVASEACIAWGQAQTRHTQLRLQLRAMNAPPQTLLLRAAWEEQYRAKFRECEEAAREEIRLDMLLQKARCS